MTVFVHTWVFSRYKGSECSVAYNFVAEMSRHCNLIVAVASNSLALNDLSEMAEYEKMPGCTFVTLKPTPFMNFFVQEILPRIKIPVAGAWFTYVWYNRWEKLLYKKVRAEYLDKIDLIHFLGPAGYHEPGYLWKLKKPYVWGSTSGFENANEILVEHYFANRKITKIKSRINNFAAAWSPRIKSAMKKSGAVVAATKSNQQIIEKKFRCKKLFYFPENLMRLSAEQILSEDEIRAKISSAEKLNIIWCASIVPRKMPNLFFDSLRLLKNKNLVSVKVIGGGAN